MLRLIIGWLIIGFVIGALARAVLPGSDRMGCLATSLLGIAGSFVGGFIGHFVFGAPSRINFLNSRTLLNFLLSIAGSTLVLWAWRQLRK
jgi:uncharacterized membrane protein YeaQ/YmgE (transglycosylase-associated protein family)